VTLRPTEIDCYVAALKRASLSPLRNAATKGAYFSSDEGSRNPTTGITGCCALVASGHATAAPPRSMMNDRRRTISASYLGHRQRRNPNHSPIDWQYLAVSGSLNCVYALRMRAATNWGR
jgi:hypothetical protein